MDKVAGLRERIRTAGDELSDWELRDLWDEAQFELSSVRVVGDLAVAAFFEADKPKERERKRAEFGDAVVKGETDRYRVWLEERRHADPPVAPFHWEVEFPEVFERENPGFDAFVGNPPFVGGRKIRGSLSDEYFDWLAESHEQSSGNADLVAHFFRRCFTLLRLRGAFGLIATNTIAQGDTRATGLRWICHNNGEIFHVNRRVKWPGTAAVIVSVVHVTKSVFSGPRRLDGREVEKITAFLFHRGGHDDPRRLAENAGKSFVGSYVLGMGFTFDDTDTKGVATSISEMQRILTEQPASREVILPYIGGEETNTSPTHAHHRFVIDFRDHSEEDSRKRWPAAMAIVDKKVRPERTRRDHNGVYVLREPLPTRWWLHADKRPALYAAIAGLERVLVNSQVSSKVQFAFLPTKGVFAHTANVFPLQTYAAFCGLQARTHEIWAMFFGSSMKDDLRYTPSDCFETFPFPEGWENDAALEAAGREYYEFRAALMVRKAEGLTKTYNRFHDPEERVSVSTVFDGALVTKIDGRVA